MADKGRESSKPGFFETPVVCPKTRQRTTAFIPRAKVEHYLKYGPGYRYYEILYLVRETLCDPHACFPYRRDEFPGYCYTREISYRYTNGGNQVPSLPCYIFAVFLTEKLVLGDFGWEVRDEVEQHKPLVSKGRLEEALWYSD